MLLAGVAMLLGPSLWEGRGSLMPDHAASQPFDPPGQSTLSAYLDPSATTGPEPALERHRHAAVGLRGSR
jgi:hypothetical protein